MIDILSIQIFNGIQKNCIIYILHNAVWDTKHTIFLPLFVVRQSIKSKSDCRCGGRSGGKPPPNSPTVAHGIAHWLLRERRQGIVPQFSACFGKNRNVKSSFSSRCLKKAFDLACKVVKAYDRILSCFPV